MLFNSQTSYLWTTFTDKLHFSYGGLVQVHLIYPEKGIHKAPTQDKKKQKNDAINMTHFPKILIFQSTFRLIKSNKKNN